MPYATWPSALENPNRPIQISNALPLVTNQPKKAGKYNAARDITRPVVRATASILLDPSEYQTFLTFWRDTLFNGRKLFTATWITISGYDGYVARLIGHSSGASGITPNVNLNLELIPDVKLDVTNTFPEIWPPLP